MSPPKKAQRSTSVGRTLRELTSQRDVLLSLLKQHLLWYDGGPASLEINETTLIADTRAAIAKVEGEL